MPDLTPIPIPAQHHWREFRIKHIPLLVFLVAVVSIVFIWKQHAVSPVFSGEVETVRADVISTVPGLLVEMEVQRFDVVKRGQVIGKVFPNDPEILKTALAAAEIELKMLQSRSVLDENRNQLNLEQLRLDLLNKRVELATAKVNLRFAESELRRQETLHEEKLVSDSEYELAKDFRDVRDKEVSEKGKLVAEIEDRVKALGAKENEASLGANVSLAEAVTSHEAQMLLKEGPITLIAPMDGVVTMLGHRSGERVIPGSPIITITSPKSEQIVAFARQPLQVVPKVGDRVQVRTRSHPRKTAIASVLKVSSAIDEMVAPTGKSQRDFPTALGNPLERGLAFSVSMPEELHVYPGETVDLVILR